MGSRLGYEYRYRFWMDNEMISRFSSRKIRRDIKFLFENRTYFIVKRNDGGGDEIIDSERYETGAEENINESGLNVLMSWRLDEYWMSDDEIGELVRKALAFAKEKAADPQHASCPIIPIAIELDVCTVQQAGEPIRDTIDRAIKTEYLFPSSLFQDNNFFDYEDDEAEHDHRFMDFLIYGLDRYRVKNDDEKLCFMEVCPICSRKPTIGAQISILEDCHHRFHYHCILRWVLENKSSPTCPTCHHPISL